MPLQTAAYFGVRFCPRLAILICWAWGNTMKKIAITLFTMIIMGVSAIAFAGATNVGTPTYKGTEIDGTPWEWTGNNYSETVAKKKGADLACKGMGYVYAVSWTTEKGQEKGTWRYSEKTENLKWCDFCQWYITDLVCYKERR